MSPINRKRTRVLTRRGQNVPIWIAPGILVALVMITSIFKRPSAGGSVAPGVIQETRKAIAVAVGKLRHHTKSISAKHGVAPFDWLTVATPELFDYESGVP